MNKNPREWPVWDNEFFGWSTKRTDPIFDWVMINAILPGVSTLILGLLTLGFLFTEGLGLPESIGFPLALLIGWAVGFMSTRMSRLYKGHGLPVAGPYSYNYSYNLKDRAKEYFSLSNSDRSLYPRDIINILHDPDLDRHQLAELDSSMRSIYTGIQERDNQKRLLSKRNVDIDGMVEYMRDSKRGIDVEVDTYKELG